MILFLFSEVARQLRNMKRVKIYVVSISNDTFEPENRQIAGATMNVFGYVICVKLESFILLNNRPDELPRLRSSLLGDVEKARTCSRIGYPDDGTQSPQLVSIDEQNLNILQAIEQERRTLAPAIRHPGNAAIRTKLSLFDSKSGASTRRTTQRPPIRQQQVSFRPLLRQNTPSTRLPVSRLSTSKRPLTSTRSRTATTVATTTTTTAQWSRRPVQRSGGILRPAAALAHGGLLRYLDLGFDLGLGLGFGCGLGMLPRNPDYFK